jgi:hypothetical protein
MTVFDLYHKHGLTPRNAIDLASGKKTFAKDLALVSTEIKSELRPRNWRFRSVKARVGSRNVRATSIRSLAERSGISVPTIYKLLYGFKVRPDIQITDIEIERKTALPTV